MPAIPMGRAYPSSYSDRGNNLAEEKKGEMRGDNGS